MPVRTNLSDLQNSKKEKREIRMKTRKLLAVLLTFALLFGCMQGVAFAADGTGLQLSATQITMLEGGDLALLEVLDAKDASITWSSDDVKVARVSPDGIVTSVGIGTALITATAENGATASCYVDVITGDKMITNDVFYRDTDGNPIQSQAGNIQKFGDKYYWYGVEYGSGTTYYESNGAQTGGSNFKAVTCYSSTDLVNWTNEGQALTYADLDARMVWWVGRMGVMYNAKNNNYVLISQFSGMLNNGKWPKLIFATSDSPTGPFKVVASQDSLKPLGCFSDGTGDQTVFVDDDGTPCLIFCSDGVTVPPYKQDENNTLRERDIIYVGEFNEDYTQIEKITKVYEGNEEYGRSGGREANSMFTINGKYYLVSSDLRGWNSSPSFVMIGDSPTGPFTDMNGKANSSLPMEGGVSTFSHVSQVSNFVKVQGTEDTLILFLGDRWSDMAGNGIGYNSWCPVTIAKDGVTPIFNDVSQFEIDIEKGTWSVGENNNYIHNPSFECDRVAGALGAIQSYVHAPNGWEVETTAGQVAQVNYGGNRGTSAAEKEFQLLTDGKAFCSPIFGNYSWYHGYTKHNEGTDAYKTRTKQTITNLEDGTYTMYGWVRSSGGQSTCEMYLKSGDQEYKASLANKMDNWTQIVLSDVQVTGGQCEIGVYSDAAADQWVMFDDLALTKNVPVSVEANQIACKPGELFSVNVTTSKYAQKPYLVSEAGCGLVSTREAKDNGDGTATWTLTLSLGSKGNRTLSVYVDGIDTGLDVKVAVGTTSVTVQPSEEVALISAKAANSAKVNKPFTATIQTSTAVAKVRLFNENGMGLAPTSCTYVDKDGVRTWTYEVSVGSVGTRTFTVKVAGSDMVWADDVETLQVRVTR